MKQRLLGDRVLQLLGQKPFACGHNRNVSVEGGGSIEPLTYTQGEVEDAQPDVQPEEEDDVGHFAEQEQVANVLLQGD